MKPPEQMFEEDAKSDTKIKIKDLADIGSLGSQLTDLEQKIEIEEQKLKHLKADYKKLSEETIPDKLREVGISEFKLLDGTKLSIQPYYSARITPENKEVCFNWLESND